MKIMTLTELQTAGAVELDSVINGDCLEAMKFVPDKSVDLILTDLPYATTANTWDSIIPFDKLWEQYKRICRGTVVLTAQTPFDKVLGCSNLPWLRYEWIWEKVRPTGYLQSAHAPMKAHENVLVFYEKPGTYNPQKTKGTPYRGKVGDLRKKVRSSNYHAHAQVRYENTGDRYPRSVQLFAHDDDGIHPTQKPVALFEYLVRTYTNAGDTVLDSCTGSGTTGVACIKSDRRFILIEQDTAIFDTCVKRLKSVPVRVMDFLK